MTETGAAHVECYSGHTYAQDPRALVWKGERYRVAQVEDRWRTPEGIAFRILTEPRGLFELNYHESKELWAIRALPDAHSDLSTGGA